jgi:hypothetical protein
LLSFRWATFRAIILMLRPVLGTQAAFVTQMTYLQDIWKGRQNENWAPLSVSPQF